MKKVAIIRGVNLNKWEMQNYEPIDSNGYSLVGLKGIPGMFDTSQIGFKIEKLPCPVLKFRKFPGGIKFLRMLWGQQEKMTGLEEKLKNFDIVHTVGTENKYTQQAIQAKKHNPELKIVATVWENILHAHENSHKQKKLKQYNLPKIDHFIAMSEKAKDILIAEGADPAKITVIYMGIDTEKFSPKKPNQALRQELGLKDNDLVICSIGRNVPEKGFDDLLRAFIGLEKDNLKLLLIVSGPKADNLINLAKELGISDKIIIKHTLAYDKVVKVHNLYDIFVLCSKPRKNWEEQLGMVLIEAMSSAKPVISTSSGSIPEVIKNTGLIFEPGNVDQLKERLEELVSDQSLRQELGQKGRQRALEIFNAQKVAPRIKAVYDKLYE